MLRITIQPSVVRRTTLLMTENGQFYDPDDVLVYHIIVDNHIIVFQYDKANEHIGIYVVIEDEFVGKNLTLTYECANKRKYRKHFEASTTIPHTQFDHGWPAVITQEAFQKFARHRISIKICD